MRVLLVIFLFLSSLSSFECDKKFSFIANGDITSLEILEQIAQTCGFSLIYIDSLSPEILLSSKPRFFVKEMRAKNFLELLLEESDLHYTLKNKILKISFLSTQTYDINYVSTSRKSSSSTDVILSQNLSSQEIQPFFPQESTQLTNAKSGTKILSVDENNFWGEIEKEITQIAYRQSDKFIDKITPSITINKNAGLLTLTATKTQHQRVKNYLSKLHNKMHAQVLIDVHIFTIKHSDSQTSGINWNEFYNLGNLSLSPMGSSGASFLSLGSGGLNMELNIFSQGVTLNRIVEFLQSYGETRSLSNPKILTLNNQPAIISVGSVLRYTQNSIYQSNTSSTSIQNSTENYPSLFAGVLLDVTPSIQGEDIILKINPSITRAKNSEVENEANALKTPPNLSTNQISSMVKLKSGEKIILGGLISNIQIKKEFKIPLLGDIPLLDLLFKYKWNSNYAEEIVIIISPKIIQSQNTLEENHFKESSRFPTQFKQLLKDAKEEELKILYQGKSNAYSPPTP